MDEIASPSLMFLFCDVSKMNGSNDAVLGFTQPGSVNYPTESTGWQDRYWPNCAGRAAGAAIP
jgi:hypothetical protein